MYPAPLPPLPVDIERPPFRIMAEGLRFPEGPIAMPDGSVILVEIERGTVSRVTPDGRIAVVGEMGEAPNGAALGPDGLVYVCNNGGFSWHRDEAGILHPTGQSADYVSGSIQTLDLATGKVTMLYKSCGGHALSGPNDIVFDDVGGFYFTCAGKRRTRERELGGLYYARADGSEIREIAFPLITPNGIGLSPDNRVLYYAETDGCRLWAFDIIEPGVLDKTGPAPSGGRLVATLGGLQRFDSLGVQANGNICVATLGSGTISVITPGGTLVRQVGFDDDIYTTNICFGGPGMKTAYVTLSGRGRLAVLDWGEPGLILNHQAL